MVKLLNRTLALIAASSGALMSPGDAVAQERGKRSPTLSELVETKSIDGLTVSPDGRSVAFRVLSPSLGSNKVTEQWFSVSVEEAGTPEPLGTPTEPLWLPVFDMVDSPQRIWSPDSSSLLVLQQHGSEVQVRRLSPGGKTTALTKDAADVVSFELSPAGNRLLYKVRDNRADIARAQAREESTGIRLDRTVITEGLRLSRNHWIGDRVTTIRRTSASTAIPAHSGKLRTIELPLEPEPRVSYAKPALAVIAPLTDADLSRPIPLQGQYKYLRLKQETGSEDEKPYVRLQLEAVRSDGTPKPCRAIFCHGLSAELKEVTGNDATGEAVVVFEENFTGRTKIFGWNPTTDHRRTIYDAKGVIDGESELDSSMCPRTGRYLICVQSGPSRPPRLVRIDLTSGQERILSDPNAQLALLSFRPSEFFSWKDAQGVTTSGILTLPAGRQSGLPLVITSYRCRGFLKGGTARLTSEHLLVAAGFASLCVNLNNANPRERDAHGEEVPVAQVRSTLASYAAAIDDLAGKGIVDRTRVGVSGHSYSSMVVAYGISHSTLFAAASIGTGITIDPVSYYFTAPTADSWRKKVPAAMGLPLPDRDPQNIWRAVSPALNAAAIRTPLLIQTPENEYLYAFQLYTAISDAGGNVDMFVYPDAGHMVTRQPLQQYWRNKRSIEWFESWLGMGKDSPRPEAGQDAISDHPPG